MNALYQAVGVSKQANHQYNKRTLDYHKELSDLVIQVDALRLAHPGCGVEKMYYTLKPKFIGRDNFIAIFMKLGYRVKRAKNYMRTTLPTHIKFPNFIQGMEVYKPNQLWQSDITYFHLNGKFYYLVFILDVYTRKIKGYHVSENMRALSNLLALEQALKGNTESINDLIHHSDRGSQYTSNVYLNLLSKHNITVSMGVKGQDNAYAERINGIIKNEYLNKWKIKDLNDLKKKVKQAVNHYNEERIHNSLPDRLTPGEFEKIVVDLTYQERPKVIIYADGKPNNLEALSLKVINQEKPMAHNCPITNNKK